jgi:SAM-dependent methyltransferase
VPPRGSLLSGVQLEKRICRASRFVIGDAVAVTEPASPAAANRAHWNAKADRYQSSVSSLLEATPRTWGAWLVPESELNVLGDTGGKQVLELGCGAAEWSGWLHEDGAIPIGLDNSIGRLSHARRRRAHIPVLQADGANLPFAASSFDLVMCDHGAIGWVDPHVIVPEVARVLRPGGRLVFSTTSPFASVCYDEERGVTSATLKRSYFDLHAEHGDDGATWYVLPYSTWTRVFRNSRLVIDELVEPRPAATAMSPFYAMDPADWQHYWPAELIWSVVKP